MTARALSDQSPKLPVAYPVVDNAENALNIESRSPSPIVFPPATKNPDRIGIVIKISPHKKRISLDLQKSLILPLNSRRSNEKFVVPINIKMTVIHSIDNEL